MVYLKVLYLVLFSSYLFTTPLSTVISNSSVKRQFYVDDTQLIFSAASCSHIAYRNCLLQLNVYQLNFLNPSKTEFLVNWYYSTTLCSALQLLVYQTVSVSHLLALLGTLVSSLIQIFLMLNTYLDTIYSEKLVHKRGSQIFKGLQLQGG